MKRDKNLHQHAPAEAGRSEGLFLVVFGCFYVFLVVFGRFYVFLDLVGGGFSE